jgi:hypothetical protein
MYSFYIKMLLLSEHPSVGFRIYDIKLVSLDSLTCKDFRN